MDKNVPFLGNDDINHLGVHRAQHLLVRPMKSITLREKHEYFQVFVGILLNECTEGLGLQLDRWVAQLLVSLSIALAIALLRRPVEESVLSALRGHKIRTGRRTADPTGKACS